MEEIKGSDLHCHDTINKQLVRPPFVEPIGDNKHRTICSLMNGTIFRHLLKILVAF
jgi:hypothetical protein